MYQHQTFREMSAVHHQDINCKTVISVLSNEFFTYPTTHLPGFMPQDIMMNQPSILGLDVLANGCKPNVDQMQRAIKRWARVGIVGYN
jgi:hypothetical protein